MAFSCDSCGGMGASYDANMIVYECSDGGIIGFNQTGLGSCGGCRARAEATCENYGHGEGLSVAPKKPRLTSGISRMRSASGDKKASGFRGNLLIPIAFAGVGALVSKNKVKGAVLGLVIPFVLIEGIDLLRK